MPPITHTYASYVNPNALCPVCGASVFFYQSANGGRVFFDELGPPWPKHPCTDNSSIPKQTVASAINGMLKGYIKEYLWQKEGWNPLFIKAVTGIDMLYLKISGIIDDEDITLYLKRVVNHHERVNPISTESIGHARRSAGTKYELSLIPIVGKPIIINAFTLLSDAREDSRNPAASEKRDYTKGRKRRTVAYGSRNLKSKTQTQKPAKVPSNNAVALAFAEARKRKDGD